MPPPSTKYHGPINSSSVPSQHPTVHKGHALPKHVVALSMLYHADVNPDQAHFRCAGCKLTYREEFLTPQHDTFAITTPELYCKFCAEAGFSAKWLHESYEQQAKQREQAKLDRAEARRHKTDLAKEDHTLTEQQFGHTKATSTLQFGKPSGYTKGSK